MTFISFYIMRVLPYTNDESTLLFLHYIYITVEHTMYGSVYI